MQNWIAQILPKVLKSRVLPLVLLLLGTYLVFKPVSQFDFLAIDDGMHTEINPRISPFTWENMASFWTDPYENAYTPLTYSAWGVAAVFARNTPQEREATKSYLNPLGNRFKAGVFHFANLVVHLMTVAVLYYFLHSLLGTISGAFIGAALFALHPLQVETVCWITGLRDVLAGLFSVLFLYAYLIYSRTRDEKQWLPVSPEIFTMNTLWYVLATVCFLLATLCKSSSLSIPIMAGVMALLLLKRPFFNVVVEALPWFVLVLPLVHIFTKLNAGVAERVVYIAPLGMRFFVALDALAFYLYKLVWPASLAMDYGRTPQFVLNETAFYWTSAVPLVLAVVLAWFCNKKWGVWAMGAFLLFIGGLLPVLGINPFIFQHISTVADRYVYLSMIGPALFIAWLYREKSKTWVAVPILSIAILGALSFRSLYQVWVWENNLTIFSHSLKETPRSWLASNNLGTVFENLRDWNRAKQLYRLAAEVSGIPSAWNNYGSMAMKLQHYNEAAEGYRRAAQFSGDAGWALANLGVAQAKLGQKKEAKELLERAIKNDPRMKFAIKNLELLEKVGPTADFKITRSDKDIQESPTALN